MKNISFNSIVVYLIYCKTPLNNDLDTCYTVYPQFDISRKEETKKNGVHLIIIHVV